MSDKDGLEDAASPTGLGPKPPTMDDLKALAPDQELMLPIVAMPSQPRLFADTIAVSVTMSRFLDLTILTMRQNLVAQSLKVVTTSETGMELKGGEISGGPLLMEEGTVRVSAQVGLNLAGAILQQLKVGNLVPEADVAASLKERLGGWPFG
jgi:hypothetical protein